MSGIVIFEGVKFFWRSRNTIDIWIVEHKSFNMYELIVYEPSMDKETPRIYLSSKELLEKVGNEEIESKLSFAKRNNVPLTEIFVAGVVNKVLADYVLNRILMKEFIMEEKKITIELRIDDCEVILREKPEELEEYKTKHYKKLLEGAVEQALQTLKEEKKELHESTTNAAELAGLNIRQRWRMPLVINKVNRGERLNANDEKIFNHVKFNMKNENDITNMKECMEMKHNISQLNTPCRTPRRHTSRRSFETTPGHSPRRNSQCPSPMASRQPSMRRPSGSSTLLLPTESSQRRLLEYGSMIPTTVTQSRRNSTDTTTNTTTNNNNGNELKRRKSKGASPINTVKSKKLVKKAKTPKNSNKSDGSLSRILSTDDAATDIDGDAGGVGFESEVEEEKEELVGTSIRGSFGIAGSFKSVLGSVKAALFGTTVGITTVCEEEEYGGKEEQTILGTGAGAGAGISGSGDVCVGADASAPCGGVSTEVAAGNDAVSPCFSGIHTEDCTAEVQEALTQQVNAYTKHTETPPETNEEPVQTTVALKITQPVRRSSQLASFLLGFTAGGSSPVKKSLSKLSLSSEKQEKLSSSNSSNVPEIGGEKEKPFQVGIPGSPKAKPTRRSSQLGSFLSGLASAALGSLVRGWSGGVASAPAVGAGATASSGKVVPSD